MESILGYNKDTLMHSFFFSKLESLHELWDYEMIYETMKNSQNEIAWALEEKEFSSDKNVISYVMAIIQNRIGEISRRKRLEEQAKKRQASMTKEDLILMEEINSRHGYVQETRDISRWL